jgi:Hypothetical glycosyl hydrolase family 15
MLAPRRLRCRKRARSRAKHAKRHPAYPNDPWILRDAAGNPVRNPGFSYFRLGNVGSASYRQQWLANVANTKRLGFDGVDIDDVLAQVSGWSKGVYPKLYPSDAAWESAMAGFMAYVGPQLKARGSYVLASAYKYGAANGSDTPAWWRTVGPHVGLMREYWVQNPNNVTQMYDTNPCCWTGNWLGWLSLADTAKSVGAQLRRRNIGQLGRHRGRHGQPAQRACQYQPAAHLRHRPAGADAKGERRHLVGQPDQLRLPVAPLRLKGG